MPTQPITASQLLDYLDNLEASCIYSTTTSTYSREIVAVSFRRVLKIYYHDYKNGIYMRRGYMSKYPNTRLKAFLKYGEHDFWCRNSFKELIHVASRYDKLKALVSK
jgi:hypothetical protein